jgi:Domain of unknown function (DUF4350)
MKNWRQFLQRYWQMILTALAIMVLVTILNAPNGSEQLKGSSYGVDPHGYAAWYQKMADKGVAIERWRQPAAEIIIKYPSGTTLLQVNSELKVLDVAPEQRKWIESGNTLIVLGIKAPPNDIEFSQDLDSPQGSIRIETTRRFTPKDFEASSYKNLPTKPESIVEDSTGAAIWQEKIGKGRLILATTPHLAANAYQDFAANYELLATLATTDRQRIVVDEYLHGYKDANNKKPAGGKANLFAYLANSPVGILFLNICLLLMVVAWQQNRRFGAVVIPQPPKIDNSSAYIQALGGVLRQARSSEFVMQNIGKSEQLKLQRRLGLGNKQLVDRETLVNIWMTQTKLPAADLPVILQSAPGSKRLNEAELQQWLTKIQAIRDQLKRQSL